MIDKKSRSLTCGCFVLVGLILFAAAGCQSSTDTLRNSDDVTRGRDKRSPSDELVDAKLLESVRAAYASDAVLAGIVVEIECYRSVIVLKGQVATKEIERKLVSVANGVTGVTVVVSRLRVGSDT